ncbi:MAG: zinc-binding alcohol dehydrogenase [Caldilineaceae bacterium]
MKKLMLYGAHDLRLEEIPLPPTLGPTQVRFKTLITGVSTGTERTLYTYTDPHWSEVIRGPLPYDMGYNNIGVVTEVGSQVTRFKPGDRVYSIAPHTTEDIFEEEGVIAKVPDGVAAEDAVFTHLFSLGLHALRRGDFTPGARVAVIGMGVIGLCTVALAKAIGAQVLAVGRGAARLEVARQLGADLVLDDAAPDFAQQAASFGGPDGIDIAVLIGSTWSALRSACKMLRHGGTVSLIGFPGVEVVPADFNPFDAEWFYWKQLTYASVSFVPRKPYPVQEVRWTLVRNYEYLLYLMQQGKLSIAPMITDRCPYTDYKRMYERMAAGDRDLIGLIFTWE